VASNIGIIPMIALGIVVLLFVAGAIVALTGRRK